MSSTFGDLGNTGLNSIIQPLYQLTLPPISQLLQLVMQLIRPLMGFLGPLIDPLMQLALSFLQYVFNFAASIPFGNITVSIIKPITDMLIPLVLNPPSASSRYLSSPAMSAAYAPPWWDNFASYIAMWGWPLLLKRVPGRGYRVLADTERMRGGEYDQPAYQEGSYQPVVGG